MSAYTCLGQNRYFEVLSYLNAENRSDHKVGMISEVDLSSVERLRSEAEILCGTRPSYTALVAKAVSMALRQHPHANRIPIERPFYRRIVQLHDVHITVAVERDKPGMEQAAFAGTIRETDRKDLAEITRELRGLAQATPETCPRWKLFKWLVESLPSFISSRIISVPRWFAGLWVEHRGGAVLISSPAKYGVDVIVGTWPWPLGFSFGLVKDRPVAVNGHVEVRPTMALTMSFDRRLMGGAPAARFFKCVVDILENAEVELGSREVQREVSAVAVDRVPVNAS
jgi:pyruvate/2-oxoglutarate dehydrogenase complex dihydrolipoamide acyltransferase (E2) component